MNIGKIRQPFQPLYFQGSFFDKYVGSTKIITTGSSKENLTTYERRKRMKRLRRRAAIEPIIGHTKADHRMRRNFLKGDLGD